MVEVTEKAIRAALGMGKDEEVEALKKENMKLKIRLTAALKRNAITVEGATKIMISELEKTKGKGLDDYSLRNAGRLYGAEEGIKTRAIMECKEQGIITRDIDGIYHL